MKKTAFLAIAAILTAACAKEIPGGDTQVNPQPTDELSPGVVLLQAGFETPEAQESQDAKVSVSDAGALTWSAEDKIAVWTSNGESGKFCEFTLYTGAGTNEASFTGTPDEGYSVSTLAVYPASAAASYEDGNLTVSYPDAYEYGEGARNVRMAAYFDDVASGLTFKHLGGLIRFSITNIPAEVNCFKLSSDKPVSGNFAVNASKEAVSAASAEDEIEISFDAGSLSAGGTFSVPVPVGSYNFTAGLYTRNGNSYTACNKSIKSTTKSIARKDYIQMKSYAVISGGIYYVKTNGSETNDGSSWAEATTLEKALYLAEDGETIKMAAGTYSASAIPELYTDAELSHPVTAEEWKVFVITSNVTIEGGYAGSSESESPDYASNVTTIDGASGAAHGFAVAAPKAAGKKVSVKGIKITNFTSPSANNAARTKDNVYLAGSYGSAIVARGTEVEFDQCTITGNTATAGGKCTVYGAGDSAVITFKDCTISGNTADNGAVANAHSSTVNFTGSTSITGNTAASSIFITDASGVISVSDNVTVSDNESGQYIVTNVGTFNVLGESTDSVRFRTNNALAVLQMSGSASMSVSGKVALADNTAKKLIRNEGGDFTMTGGKIYGNVSTEAAGVLFNKSTTTLDGVEIYHNSGTYALLYNYSSTNLTVSACDIYENTLSASSAGAVLWSDSPITVNNGTNIRNHTGAYAMKGNGGALYTKGAAILDHVRIKDNSGLNMIYVDNASASVAADSLTIMRNTVSSAGGVFNNSGGLLSVNNSRIQSNTSTGVGVVLQAFRDGVDSYTYISNSTIAQNTGTQRTLYLREKSHSVLTNCTIYANPTSTASQGGAVVLYGASGKLSQAYLISCTITGNGYNSGTAGGLQLYNSYTEARLYNSMIAGNRGTNPRDMNPDHAGVLAKAYCALGNSSTGYRAAAFYRSDSSVITGEDINWEDGQFFGGDGASSRYTQLYDGTVIPLGKFNSTTKPVGNPLMELGMPYSELTAIADPYGKGILTADILGKDQLGNSREGKTYIGAWVGSE